VKEGKQGSYKESDVRMSGIPGRNLSKEGRKDSQEGRKEGRQEGRGKFWEGGRGDMAILEAGKLQREGRKNVRNARTESQEGRKEGEVLGGRKGG
jgi:hypothetical protein